MKDDEMTELTLFDKHVKELLQGTNQEIVEDTDTFSSALTAFLPVKISFTPSPKKDKTVSSFKK